VTLAAVAGVDIDAAQAAVLHCRQGLDFGRVVLIASTPPTRPDSSIEHIAIGPLSYFGYNAFMLQSFYKYVDTRYALTVQSDGFILNPDKWNPEWLNYDYVGAPWPEALYAGKYRIELVNRVGNSGLCLRSRALLEATSPINLKTMRFPSGADDLITCHLLYEYLQQKGLRFADMETAAAFSIEHPDVTCGHTLETTFGFHGKHFLPMVNERGQGLDVAAS